MFGLFRKEKTAGTIHADVLTKQLRAVEEISTLLVSGDSLDNILSGILKKIPSVLGVNLVSTLLWEKERRVFIISKTSVPPVILRLSEKALNKKLEGSEYPGKKRTNIFVKSATTKSIQVTSDIASSLTPIMSSRYASAIVSLARISMKLLVSVPLVVGDEVLGVIALGWKKKTFTSDDESILTTFANQTSIAMVNASLHAQGQSQIEQLRIKNQMLNFIFDMTQNIFVNYDPTKITQDAADFIPKELGYIGATIGLIDEQKNELYLAGLTKNKISEQVRKLLGGFDSFRVPLNDPKYQGLLEVQALKRGKAVYSDDLAKALSPPISERFIGPIKRIVGAKSVAVFPLKRHKDYGTIIFILDRKLDQVTQMDKDFMQTFSTFIGLALDNAHSFKEQKILSNKLEQASKDLRKKVLDLEEVRRRERDMLDVMGHELRTPLSIIKGSFAFYKSLVEKYLPEDLDEKMAEKLDEYEARIADNTEREIKLVEMFLGATKIEKKKLNLAREAVEVKQMLEYSVLGQKRLAERKGLFVKYVEPENLDKFPKIYADKLRILEVIDNLVSNGVKYTDTGGVTVTVEHDENFVTFHVKDTGRGIPEHEVKNLGKKFYRIKQFSNGGKEKEKMAVRTGGTGLGLYVAFGVVRAHGGKIWVDSIVGKGSTFHFSVPIFKGQDVEERKIQEANVFKRMGMGNGSRQSTVNSVQEVENKEQVTKSNGAKNREQRAKDK